MSSDRDDGGAFTQDYIDERLARVFRATGSSLQNYTPHGKEELRKTMRKLLEDVRALAARQMTNTVPSDHPPALQKNASVRPPQPPRTPIAKRARKRPPSRK